MFIFSRIFGNEDKKEDAFTRALREIIKVEKTLDPKNQETDIAKHIELTSEMNNGWPTPGDDTKKKKALLDRQRTLEEKKQFLQQLRNMNAEEKNIIFLSRLSENLTFKKAVAQLSKEGESEKKSAKNFKLKLDSINYFRPTEPGVATSKKTPTI